MSNGGIEMSRMARSRRHSCDAEGTFETGIGTSGSSSGKRMDRTFGSVSILALSLTILASWEGIASGIQPGLMNGGPASLFWGMLLSITGTLALVLSFAELASICPLAGAQYHWTAVLAPPRIRPFATWIQGWVTVFAWQTVQTSVCFQLSWQMVSLASLNNPDYTPARWHVTLIMLALVMLSFAVNVYGIKILPALQMMGGLMHIAFFIVIVIPVLLLAPRSTPKFVFTQLLTSDDGWQLNGVAWCLGMLTVTFCFLGFDGAIHMCEEVHRPAEVIPRVLVQSIAINGTLAFAFLLVLLFCIGNVQDALQAANPVVQIFYNATGSVKAATAMQCAITIFGIVTYIAVAASASRLTWAFARDGGLPYAKYFAHVDRKYRSPKRAISLVCCVVVILSFINLGSTEALSAILALTTSSLYGSYLVSLAVIIARRFNASRDPIPFGPWTLGRYGLAINIYAFLFGVFICIFVPFPTKIPVTATNMNWSGPVFLAVLILIIIDWLFRARNSSFGPAKGQLPMVRRH